MVMGTEPSLCSGKCEEGQFATWVQSSFRGAGQVIFMDNPFAGLLIVVGTMWDAFWPGLLGLVASAVSALFGLYAARDNCLAKHGLHGYNAHLVGCLIGRIAGCQDANTFGVLLAPTIIYALFSNVVFIALGNVLVPHFDVPALTLPFNIAGQFWIATMSMSPRFPGGPSPVLPQVVVSVVNDGSLN
jgi:urea transporter